MPSFDVKIDGLDRIVDSLNRAPKATEDVLQKAIVASAAEIQKAATRPDVPWRTGNLVQSFGNGIVIGHLVAEVGPTANYAVYVHEGTRPHVITPKAGKALFWKGAAHPVGSVKHPGTKPNRFVPRILAKATPKIEGHFERAIQMIIDSI